MVMTGPLEEWEFLDPADVLERKRGERCVGCMHAVLRKDHLGAPKRVCRKGRKYGKRCAKYKEIT
ncbi:hypothetical protein BX589_101236 [Paraburkholderia fungorum]|jgi:hypothetical protein|nr:hypothetical protein BX589_101236 [Paraburkholderia fungorum]